VRADENTGSVIREMWRIDQGGCIATAGETTHTESGRAHDSRRSSTTPVGNDAPGLSRFSSNRSPW